MIVECPGCKSRYDVTGRPAGTRARCRCGTVFTLPAPGTEAVVLTCPNCGAPVGPHASSCQYCRAELLVRACPRCFARIFQGYDHCPHCGAEVATPARANPDGTARKRDCPRCAGDPQLLMAHLIGGVLLDECPTCHGVWLDSAAVDRVLRERGEEANHVLKEMSAPASELAVADATGPIDPGTAAIERQATPEPAILTTPVPMRVYISCPDCGTTMNRVNFARRSGIIVDVCRDHGTWFDDTELPRVIEFVLKGGVEESARKDAQQALEDARRARAEAEATRLVTSTTAMGRPFDTYDRRFDLFGNALGAIARLLK